MQVLEFPALSFAVHVTIVVVPTGKVLGDVRLQECVGDWSKLSVTVGLVQDTSVSNCIILSGHMIIGACVSTRNIAKYIWCKQL